MEIKECDVKKTGISKFEILVKDLATLENDDVEKVSIFVQGIMAMRDKKSATA